MAEPFLAEIMIVGFNFPPRGWSQCDGQILPINQNQSLFSLLGTTYGGDGRTTFALPDLRGRTPTHPDVNALGAKAGEESAPLSVAQMPRHSHQGRMSTATATTGSVDGTVPAVNTAGNRIYGPLDAATTVSLNPGSISNTGAGAGHDNMQPFLALNFVIALQGLFPPRN